MPYVTEFDTIAAIATATGSGGIGIVRISGEDAVKIADSIFVPKSGEGLLKRKSHTMTYGRIVFNGETVDEALVSVMLAPNTYTRENIAEINCHGGYSAVTAVLDAVLKSGARIAQPGEFTKRAFLNGRIDLAQAQAVTDVINAGTEESRKAAVARLEGRLSKKIRSLRENLITMIAHIEVNMDYPEHDNETQTFEYIRENTEKILSEVSRLISGAETGRILKEGIKTVILGRPNVGKSSLLNSLLEEERAIVTDIPGTTRDILQESLNLGGIPLNLIDTAGIRDTADTVEKMGVERSRKYAREAELILAVIDSSSPLTPEDTEILELTRDKKAIILLNKTDLERTLTPDDMRKWNCTVLDISAKKETGLEALEAEIRKMFLSGEVNISQEAVIGAERDKASLIKAKQSLENVLNTIDGGLPEDFLTMDLTEAYTFLGEIVGEAVEDDIIDKIFSEFCLGK
ncbi:MAG: tRNA uridine-5-carboxymethylaminomethyl(34) synthesis GTPase MnmE [Firmicutes bacterium]|nr:tRNA uridine-5-carboxymethylaminomethyl(34) synthesis GTPase MnmE [Bacillota bacterium]